MLRLANSDEDSGERTRISRPILSSYEMQALHFVPVECRILFGVMIRQGLGTKKPLPFGERVHETYSNTNLLRELGPRLFVISTFIQ